MLHPHHQSSIAGMLPVCSEREFYRWVMIAVLVAGAIVTWLI